MTRFGLVAVALATFAFSTPAIADDGCMFGHAKVQSVRVDTERALPASKPVATPKVEAADTKVTRPEADRKG
jgi:hypothetical protein